MLVLFETPAGYAFFKLLNENKLKEVDNLYKDFQSPESAGNIVKLKHFEKFDDTTEALAATTAAVEGKVSKCLKKVLKKFIDKDTHEKLLVADAKLGTAIKDKFNLQCMTNTSVQELMRCIRSQIDSLIGELPKKELTAMALGLAHSLSRYKLKFSPDKIDTMIVQAVSLLDDLDKELNNYIMRCREWYGWHFPELGKIITDNVAFVKTVKLIGTRENIATADLSDILPEELEEKVKETAEISMGTEISLNDIVNIQNLCDQVVEISNYREQLYDYLKARMMAMAPNLSILVGDLVGARLISHAGSLINLAKHPASTVQILGAEKALFRALKTKKETPKYGLIYHSQLIGQSSVKNKGKMARMLAAKAALAVRVDALGEETNFELGASHKAKLESRLKILEDGNIKRISGTAKAKAKFEKYHGQSENKSYLSAADSVLPSTSRKRFANDDNTGSGESPKSKKKKLLIEDIDEETVVNDVKNSSKKKKIKSETVEHDDSFVQSTEKKKKKKSLETVKTEENEDNEDNQIMLKKKNKEKLEMEVDIKETQVDKKKKKKKKNLDS